MDKTYLLEYLVKNAESEYLKKHIELLKIELDWHLYYFGDHFASNRKSKKVKTIPQKLLNLYNRYSAKDKFTNNDEIKILSTVYFSNFNSFLRDLKFDPISPYWNPIGKKIAGNRRIIELVQKINYSIKNNSFAQLISPSFQAVVTSFKQEVKELIVKADFAALMLYTDQYLYSKIAIDNFRELNRPSFILSHGLPGIYSQEVDNRSDYLLVWGEKIRENYIKAGFNADKILVTGHPSYATLRKEQKTIKSNMENILVLAKAVSPHQHTYNPVINDRGAMVVYLESIKKVLKNLGVQKARLRSHPTMNVNWLLEFLGNDFFIPDRLSIMESLKKSTMVIGPTSTVLLESVFNGVNYITFEPLINGRDILGGFPVPPFDGKETQIPLARNEYDLKQIIKSKQSVTFDFLSTYLAPFDLSIIKKYI